MNKSNSRSDQNLLGAQPDVVRQTVDDSLLGRPHVAEKAFSTEATKVMPKGEKTPDERFADLQDMTRGYLTDEEEAKLEKAFRFAANAHEGACRKSGEPFIAHPVEVAIILADLRMDVETLCAALLHDTVEDTDVTSQLVDQEFGPHVAQLVDGVTKITRIEVETLTDEQAATIRKMFVAMSKDIRVIVIKLADRLHNMRTLVALPPDRRVFKAHETMDVYAPLADRLGISSIKWELEDLAFFYLEPEEYQRIARMVQDSRDQRERDTEEAIKTLTDELRRVGLSDFQITGRPKHLWSIYLKMKRKGKEFADIYDLIALRVITDTVGDCYSALGAVHSLWHPLPGRFKDYIATPKPNGYQSLHTTVVGPEARPIEIQIRTREMHEQAEFGIAAHWLYKRAGNSKGDMSADDKSVDKQISWIRRSLDWTVEGDIDDPHEFLEDLRVDLFEDEIFVFTPKGEVMSLRAGSTPLDFAYAVHTEVGNHCVGAKVNGSVVSLTRPLATGDRIEILTNKNAKPSRDWMNIVRTPSARTKIRKYFAASTKSDDADAGRSELARQLRKRGYGISTPRSVKALGRVAEQQSFKTVDDMLAAIANGKLTAKSVANKVQAILEEGSPAEILAAQRKAQAEEKAAREQFFTSDTAAPMTAPRHTGSRAAQKRRNSCGVVVKGDPDLLVHLARCCNPVAGDDIVGFVTRGRGVSVHRSNCPNVKSLMEHPERLIGVEWDTSGATQFQVEIMVEATDRMGLLKDVTQAVGDAGGNILSAATSTSARGVARLRFLVAISDASLLDTLLASVGRVPSVYDARRIMPGEGANMMSRRG